MIDDDLRDRLIAAPELLLGDRELLAALADAADRDRGDNVVDLRAVALDRLTARLDRLEEMHRSVIAAAYENTAGTNQVHRAVLRLLDAEGVEDLLAALDTDLGPILRVDAVRLVLEGALPADGPAHARAAEGVVAPRPAGFVAAYLAAPSAPPAAQRRPETLRPETLRTVTLRGVRTGDGALYGAGDAIRSEALIRLDLGPAGAAGLLALGARDPQQFRAGQGTDLLDFLGGVVARLFRRWLA